jgi:hypothetical protein
LRMSRIDHILKIVARSSLHESSAFDSSDGKLLLRATDFTKPRDVDMSVNWQSDFRCLTVGDRRDLVSLGLPSRLSR